MRNIDWLCENDREALAKIIAEGDECECCAFEIEDDCGIRCCEGVRKWLEAEHNDGSAPVLEPDSNQLEPDTSGTLKVDACGRISAEDFAKAISDGMKKVNAAIESHGKTHDFYAFDELDTREKLEADVMNYYTHTVSTALWPDSANKKTKYVNVSMDQVLGWLDRQKAITERELRREIAERFIELPVDADNVPIHLGDRLDNFGEKFVCEWIEYDTDNVSVGYATSYGELPPAFAPDECTHVKLRTIEDVLYEFGCKYNYRYPNTGNLVEETAAELREMMKADDD